MAEETPRGATPWNSRSLSHAGVHGAVDDQPHRSEASGEAKRLLLLFQQRGCIYCTQMREEVFPDPDVARAVTGNCSSCS